MIKYIQTLQQRANHFLWEKSLSSTFFRAVFALYAVLRDLSNGYIVMCAKSLVYTTLLSLVPLLAVSFSFLKAFGVHNQVKPLLGEALLPLGQQGVEITDNIVGFIDNVNVGVLGAVGIIVLLFTVVSVISTVESTLNSIWHIAKPRSIAARISYYLSVIIVAPVLVFTGLGLTASLLSGNIVQTILTVEPLGSLYYLLVLLAPYFLLTLAFGLVYVFLPNTKVELKAAFVGAVVAAIMWRVAGDLFAQFVANFSNYDAIYSGFAALILFLIWLFVSWLIFLFGGKLAFYFQHPEYIPGSEAKQGSSSYYRFRLVLTIMYLIGTRYINDEARLNAGSLTKLLRVPSDDVLLALEHLKLSGMLIVVEDNKSSLMLSKDMKNIEAFQLYETSKKLTQTSGGIIAYECEPVETLIDKIEASVEKGLEGKNMDTWFSDEKLSDEKPGNEKIDNES